MTTLWLDAIPVGLLREQATAAFETGDALLFLGSADNLHSLDLVARNVLPLKERGIYERALLAALIATRTNNRLWSLGNLTFLLSMADRDRLRAAGDPLPGPGPFQIFRGVAGRGAARRVRGISWTGSRERAEWFAKRFQFPFGGATFQHLPDPAVFTTTVREVDVLAYVNSAEVGRAEEEFIVLLPASCQPVRLGFPNSEKGGA